MARKITLKKGSTEKRIRWKIPMFTGSRIADIIILLMVAYIIYGWIAFGVPSTPMAPGVPEEDDSFSFNPFDYMG